MSNSPYGGRHSKPGPLRDENDAYAGKHALPSDDADERGATLEDELDEVLSREDDDELVPEGSPDDHGGSGDESHLKTIDLSGVQGEYVSEDKADGGSGDQKAEQVAYIPAKGSQEHHHHHHRHHRRRRRVIRAIVIVVIVIVAALAACGVAFAMSARSVKADASTLTSQASALEKQLSNGDMSGARRSATAMGDAASDLHAKTDGPLWILASHVPVYGSDVRQVRVLASVADDMCSDVLQPVLDDLPEDGLKSLFTSDGAVNASVLQSVLGALADASPSIDACTSELDGLGDVHIDQIREPVTKAKSALTQLGEVASASKQLAPVVGDMLGANGTRTYLVLACNNAEVRSLGGMPGSFGTLTVEDGKMSFGNFAGASSFPWLDDSEAASITDEERLLFGSRVSTQPRDANSIPDFSRAGKLEHDMWAIDGKGSVDGVISVDPVFLQSVLGVTGGVTVDGIDVNGSNAAQILMHDIYSLSGGNHDYEDAFFAQVAQEASTGALQSLSSSSFQQLLSVISDGFEGNHLYIWMESADEEAALDALGWTGRLSTDTDNPETGIYFTAAIGGKMYWYLDAETSIGSARKNSDGSTSYDVVLTLSNTMDPSQASSEPDYVTMPGAPLARTLGDIPIYLHLVAPAGGSITNVDDSDGYYSSESEPSAPTEVFYPQITEAGMVESTYNGFDVWYGLPQVAPGESMTVRYTVTTAPGATGDLQVRMTPSPRA